MRKTRLKQVSTAVCATLLCAAVLFALVRAFVIHPNDSMAVEGSALFHSKGCAQCHFTDSRETKIGPGLEGLFERRQMPVSGMEVTEENVIKQLETPYKHMPSFAGSLTAGQKNSIVSYLKTL